MKAKSVLLTVPLAVSALTFLTLPANAVCWSWKPCADQQGYGYGGTTESQAVLPPFRQTAVCLRARRRSGPSARGHGGARSSRVAGTAETCQEAGRDGDRGATTCIGGEAKAEACSSAGANGSATSAAGCSGESGTASGASTGPGPGSGTCGTSAGACAYASPGEGGAASAADPQPVPAQAQAAPPPQPAPAPKPAPAQAAAPGIGAGHDADGARHGDHAGDPRIGESGRGGEKRRKAVSGFDAMRCCVDG